MQRKTNFIPPAKLLPLCRLLADDLGMPAHFPTSVIESLIHWWAESTDENVLAQLRLSIQLLARSSLNNGLAESLAHSIDVSDQELTDRTLEVLRDFPESIDASATILIKVLRSTVGPDRWQAASSLSKLGIKDDWILTQLTAEALSDIRAAVPSLAPTRVFKLDDYRAIYEATLNASTASAKGKSLEDLAEYIFLCIPGINTIARNLRTLAEEIDLAFSNSGVGFWREIGDPFIVECKNLSAAVEAKMIRDFRMKLQTKGLRAGFVVTTNRLTREAIIELRQSLADGRAIIALERVHLEAIANGTQLGTVLAERFYTCRLL